MLHSCFQEVADSLPIGDCFTCLHNPLSREVAHPVSAPLSAVGIIKPDPFLHLKDGGAVILVSRPPYPLCIRGLFLTPS